jgi:predicted DNA-binding transcriptional regulator AlpA
MAKPKVVSDRQTTWATARDLATVAELARIWGVSRQRAAKVVSEHGFPEAYELHGGQLVYSVAEANAWRAARRASAAARGRSGVKAGSRKGKG